MSTPIKQLGEILNNKKTALLGLGSENFALLKYIMDNRIDCEATVCDARGRQELSERIKELEGRPGYDRLDWRLGEGYDGGLTDFDFVLRSPGYPLWKEEIRAVVEENWVISKNGRIGFREKPGTLLTSPMRLFMRICPTKKTIGITGTKGKGTTASLIAHIMEKAGKTVFLGGNIGTPPFSFLDRISEHDWVVLELSSFQLEDFDKSPRLAVINNFYPDHLSAADPNNPNCHRSLEEYWEAKLRITAWQGKHDAFFVNRSIQDRAFPFGSGQKHVFRASELESQLIGDHNKENVGAAAAVAEYLKIKPETIAEAVRDFPGLPHRLEPVAEHDGVKYYNESFATTPETAMTAINAFGAPVILLAGGSDKGADFTALADMICHRVKVVILLPGSGSDKLEEKLLARDYPEAKIFKAGDMAGAVRASWEQSLPGDIILLSPACASFGIFKNYVERGKLFKEKVKIIISNNQNY